MSQPIIPPWEQQKPALDLKRPAMLVDLRRCIGCHACSVACKTEHSVPLGEFRIRVRWLPRPDRPTLAFLPLFNRDTCDFGVNRGQAGLEPACVAACPTKALVFGDLEDVNAEVHQKVSALQAVQFDGVAPTKNDVYYVGLESWMETNVGQGVALSPGDPDIIYEQGPNQRKAGQGESP